MREIVVKSQRHGDKTAFVDDEDYDFLSRFSWTLNPGGYANYKMYIGVREPGTSIWVYKRILMHHMIMGKPLSGVIDHIDGNKLNNTRANLRYCTQQQNSCNQKRPKNNTSGFIGVSWCIQTQRWMTQIGFHRQNIKVGRYHDLEEAAYIYDQFALQLHGEFAATNLL